MVKNREKYGGYMLHNSSTSIRENNPKLTLKNGKNFLRNESGKSFERSKLTK